MSDWKDGLDAGAIKRAADAGEILPKLPLPVIEPGKQSSTETLLVRFLGNPRKVTSEKLQQGFAYFADVENQGAKKSLLVPKSLRFSLAKECEAAGMEGPAGHQFVVGASKEDMKATANRPAMKDVTLYWCQLKKKETAPAEPIAAS